MKTALEVIKKAMRELGILQTQEEPSADEAQDALDLLNGLLQNWELDGIGVNHVDMVLTDTLPYPDNHYLPIAYNLAVELAAEFGVSVRSDTAAKAANGYRQMQNYYHKPTEMSFDSGLNPVFNANRPGWRT